MTRSKRDGREPAFRLPDAGQDRQREDVRRFVREELAGRLGAGWSP